MSKTAETLQEFLQNPTDFSAVNLHAKNITNDDCTKLAAVLKDNKTITNLHLSSNQIDSQGAAALAGSLKVNKSITHLHLSSNQIGDQGAASLAEALKVNKTVASLHLSSNQIGDQGAASLAEALKVNKTVASLHLSSNQIGDQGAAVLAESLKVNKTVTLLELAKNEIGVQGLTLLEVNREDAMIELDLKDQDPGKALFKALLRAKHEAAEKAILKAKLQEAEEKLAAMAKAKQAKQEAKAAKIETEKLAQKAKLEKVAEVKAAKEVAKLKVLEEEKVKEYAPEIDLNITKIFAEGAPVAGDLADHNQTIRQVLELIRDGNDHLQEHSNKGLLLLGHTKAGKSTLAHLLSGRKLQAITDGETGELIVDAMQPLADIVIGHNTAASETKIPNKCLVNGTVIWDCPGFKDTDPVQEIANSFYIKKLFETIDEIKFVLVVPEHHLVKDGCELFLATLSSFMKTFSNIKVIEGSISLVITQVSPHKKPQHIKASIEKILKDNQSVTEEQRMLVNKLINPSLHLFYKPKDEGEFRAINPLEAIEASSQYIKSSSDMANMSISANALECALPLLSTASSNFNKILEITTKAVLAATDCLKANPNNLFAQNYHIIKDMVPVSIYHKNLAPHQENEYFLELELLSGLQKILGSNQAGSMPEGLSVLRQALETIAEYAGSGNIALKNQIQDYGYCLQQQYEYVKFFAGVCGKELPVAQGLAELLQLCRSKVAENLEFQVSSLHIDQSQLDEEYYHKAIGYLENYPASKPCVKLKALCYSGLASFSEDKNDSDGAIGYYIKAMEADNQQPEIYEKLGKLFFSKGQYAKAIEAYKVVNNEFKIKACFKAWLTQDAENPDIMLKQAEYFESIGLFEKAKMCYHHAFSLSKNEDIKVSILEKIGNIMVNSISQGQNFIIRAEEHDLYNYDLVDAGFIHNLLGDAAIFDNFHA
jgi:hypothetical protein